MIERTMAEPDDDQPTEDEEQAADDQAEEGDGLTIGERQLLEVYADFRKELDALPNAPAFQALVTKYGQEFGYRSVGRWISGRGPKSPKTPPSSSPRAKSTDA